MASVSYGTEMGQDEVDIVDEITFRFGAEFEWDWNTNFTSGCRAKIKWYSKFYWVGPYHADELISGWTLVDTETFTSRMPTPTWKTKEFTNVSLLMLEQPEWATGIKVEGKAEVYVEDDNHYSRGEPCEFRSLPYDWLPLGDETDDPW